MSLESLLMQRVGEAPTAPQPASADPITSGLVAPPPEPKDRLPTAFDRWLMAEKMKQGYRNNWFPNPVIMKNTEQH
jgi:hypothetical protein